NGRAQRPQRIIGKPPNCAGVSMLIYPGDTESHRRVPLSGHRDRSHPVGSLVRSVAGGWLIERSGLVHTWRLARCDAVEVIPPNSHACVSPPRRTGIVHTNVLSRPEVPVAKVCAQQAIISRIKITIHPCGIPQVWHGDCRAIERNGDSYVAGDRWSAAWITDPPQLKLAVYSDVHPNEVTFSGRGIVIICPLRRVRPGQAPLHLPNQVRESSHNDRSAVENRTLSHDKGCGSTKRALQPSAPEEIHRNVERISVNPQCVIVPELRSVRLKVIERPNRVGCYCAGVTYRDKDPIGRRPAKTRDVNHCH